MPLTFQVANEDMNQRADAPGGIWASEGPLPCDVLCPVEDVLWKNSRMLEIKFQSLQTCTWHWA